MIKLLPKQRLRVVHTITFVCPECFNRMEVPLGGVKQAPKCSSCYQDGIVSIMKKIEPESCI